MLELKKIKRIPWGFHFKDPDFVKKREALLLQADTLIKKAGFERVIPPGLDYANSFERAAMSDWQAHIMRLSDGYGENLALRPDLTIQVIKGLANQMNRETLPAYLYYTENTFRNTKKRQGSLREQFQIGAEIVGAAEFESLEKILSLIIDIIEKIGPDKPFKISLGHVGFFEKLSLLWHLSDSKKNEFASILNRKNIPDLKKFFHSNPEIEEYSKLFISTLLSFGEIEKLETLQKKWNQILPDKDLQKVFSDYIAFYHLLKEKKLAKYIFVDFAMIRDFRYYTGIVFEGYIKGSGNKIFSGGSYNNLFEKYSGTKENACGFAIILDNLEFYRDTELEINKS